jgi:hypothetical protein
MTEGEEPHMASPSGVTSLVQVNAFGVGSDIVESSWWFDRPAKIASR